MDFRTAIVLPPREGFSVGSAGAIALLVRGMAGPRDVVLGRAEAAPFAGVAYRAVRPSWFPGRLGWRYARGVAAVVRGGGIGLVEVHNRPDVALFLARRCPALPVMLFLHNDPQGMRGARSAGERGRLVRRLARVVCVSEHIKGRFVAGGVGGEVAVLENFIDVDAMPDGVARGDVILFAGRVVADKGADAFVAACALALPELPGWRAEMIGADRFGADSPETTWLAALRPRAAAAGVAMRGYQPHGAVLRAMAGAAMVVVPSRWAEPFGMTALEAMAAGAALIASDRGGLREVIGDAAVVIDPEDEAAIAAAMVALARDPARRAGLAALGLARARRFDIGVARARLAQLRSDVRAAWPNGGRHPI